jgi:DNA mismatch repair protein MutS
MQVDKITLQDIGLFDNEDHVGLANHLNFCKSNGGQVYLRSYLHNPLSNLTAIQDRQKALTVFIDAMIKLDGMKISNGTCLIIEKFFETSFKNIPVQISLPGAYWYQFWNKADYSLIKYSVEHLVLFIQNLMDFVAVFEQASNNPVLENLVQKINKLLQHPDLAYLKDKQKITNPQEILALGHFFLYRYKNNTNSLLELFYELDALYSLAKAHQVYHFQFPHWIDDEKPYLAVEQAAHPPVSNAIGNDLTLSPDKNFLFLTGANMAGKSTFIKTIGIVVYLSHIGMGAPAQKITLTVMDGLITNLNIADNVVKGESYFYNEVQRIKNTVLKINDGKKNCVLIDELFKGTNILDAMKCSTKVIEGLQKLSSSLYILSTHLYEISENLQQYQNIQFSYFETSVKDKELHFEYHLTPGISQDRIGYLILEREGVVTLLDAI